MPTTGTPDWNIVKIGNHFSYDPITGLLQDGFVKGSNKLMKWNLESCTGDDRRNIGKAPLRTNAHSTFVGLEYACTKYGHRFFIDPSSGELRNSEVVNNASVRGFPNGCYRNVFGRAKIHTCVVGA